MHILQTCAAAMLFSIGSLASADTISYAITFQNHPLTYATSQIVSDPFALFNPSLGTLTAYSLHLVGSGNSTDVKVPFIFVRPLGVVSYSLTYTAYSRPFTFDVTGNVTNAHDLDLLTGTSNAARLEVVDGGQNNPTEVTNLIFNSAQLTYTYTPSAVTAPAVTPEPSTLILLGTGIIGAFQAVRRQRR